MSRWINKGKQYTKGTLVEGEFETDPIALFSKWFQEVQRLKSDNFSWMVLSTIGTGGMPASRIVLLKEFSEEGFVFFTDYGSKKAQEIKKNNRVALVFFCLPLEKQVIVQGRCKKISSESSDAYFETRPKNSQISSWVSRQSRKISSRDLFVQKFEKMKKQYTGQSVPRPESWGGYLVAPKKIEFWQGRPYRLNDRILFQKKGRKWEYGRLSP